MMQNKITGALDFLLRLCVFMVFGSIALFAISHGWLNEDSLFLKIVGGSIFR